jgi:hypothetical protein
MAASATAQSTTPAVDVTDIPDDPFRGKSTEFILRNASPDRAYTAEVWGKILKSLRLRGVNVLDAEELVISKGDKDFKVVRPVLTTRSEKGTPGFIRTVYGTRRKPIVAAFGLSDGVGADETKTSDKSEKKKRLTPEQWVALGKTLDKKRSMRFDVSNHADIVQYFEELNLLLRQTVQEKYDTYNKRNGKKLFPTFVIPGRAKVDTNDNDEPGSTLKVFCHLERGADFQKGLCKYVPKFVRVTEWGPNDEPIKTEEIEDLSSLVNNETHCIVETIMPEFSTGSGGVGFMAKQGGLVIYVVEHQMDIDVQPTHGWSSTLEDKPAPVKVVTPAPEAKKEEEEGTKKEEDEQEKKSNPKKRGHSSSGDDASSTSTTDGGEAGDGDSAEPDAKKAKLEETSPATGEENGKPDESASQQPAPEAPAVTAE